MILLRFCSASIVSVALGIVLAGFVSANAYAQAPGLTAKPLLRTTLSGDDTKESVMVSVEFAPGGVQPGATRTQGTSTRSYFKALSNSVPKAAKRGEYRWGMPTTIPEV